MISDSLRARLDLVNAEQAVLQGETALRAARFALGRQVGVPEPVVPVRPADLEPGPLALSRDEIMTLAESASPAVVAATENLQVEVHLGKGAHTERTSRQRLRRVHARGTSIHVRPATARRAWLLRPRAGAGGGAGFSSCGAHGFAT